LTGVVSAVSCAVGEVNEMPPLPVAL